MDPELGALPQCRVNLADAGNKRFCLADRISGPYAVVQTGQWLQSVVQGYFNYHAVPGNTNSLRVFRYRVTLLWRKALLRRSQRHRLNWERMRRLAQRWLPEPRVLHPYPSVRFDAQHPR
jgi:RNA-directed DNA polymerase